MLPHPALRQLSPPHPSFKCVGDGIGQQWRRFPIRDQPELMRGPGRRDMQQMTGDGIVRIGRIVHIQPQYDVCDPCATKREQGWDF